VIGRGFTIIPYIFLRLLSILNDIRGPVIRLPIGLIWGIPPDEAKMTRAIELLGRLKQYGDILYRWISGRYCSVDRGAAEELYDAGKEPTVAKLLEYDAENKRLKERIAQLEKNSTNSSKPPSSDNPQDKNPRPESTGEKKRKPGGQPGHKGSNRELIPVEEVNDVIHYYPERCQNCGNALPQDGTANEVGEPFRWQVTEIEPIKPSITEHQVHSSLCGCGCQTPASLPAEVAKSNFGPRLTSIIAYLAAVLHVSRRGTLEFCQTLLDVNIALGSVQNLLEDTSTALAPIDKELKDALPQEPVINSDETGWRDRWLWIFVGAAFIYFKVAKTRSSRVLVDVLGKVYKGILCVDRWGAYTKYHKGLFQICWAVTSDWIQKKIA
jgi:transposase